jgi:hypothetical protein
MGWLIKKAAEIKNDVFGGLPSVSAQDSGPTAPFQEMYARGFV